MLKSAQNREKRRWPRHTLGTPIRLLTQKESIDARGITVNDGGMCVFAVASLGIGTQVQVEFVHPHSRELVRAQGAVRNRAVYLYGIEFVAQLTRNL